MSFGLGLLMNTPFHDEDEDDDDGLLMIHRDAHVLHILHIYFSPAVILNSCAATVFFSRLLCGYPLVLT